MTKYTCTKCNKIFDGRYALKNHIARRYPCNLIIDNNTIIQEEIHNNSLIKDELDEYIADQILPLKNDVKINIDEKKQRYVILEKLLNRYRKSCYIINDNKLEVDDQILSIVDDIKQNLNID